MEFASTIFTKNPTLQYSEGEAEISDDELQSLKVDWQVIEYNITLLMYLDFLG